MACVHYIAGNHPGRPKIGHGDTPREQEMFVEKSSGPDLEFLMLKRNNGNRLLIPREDLGELKNFRSLACSGGGVLHHRLDIWWPKLDDGLYVPDFLEHRWGKVRLGVAA